MNENHPVIIIYKFEILRPFTQNYYDIKVIDVKLCLASFMVAMDPMI